ncbi:uncharacterized protein LOC141914236 [Tubulanus polymorphus]|uniref:uncharacterized protein LOC141914236 n=1 Tax=Tubulanus polymorphus TaxID=672921 RepID=UPI003DA632BC
MNENDRQQFLKWHAEQLEKHFDMQTELVEYCRSDVDILMQSVVKFQELFYSITSVDPFDGCITIAAACNLALRSRFLKPDTIGLIPPGGYKPNAKYSKMAVRWLKWLAVEKNLDIKHVLNGGEVTLGKFKVDGFHEKTRTVYEFNGCYFHGCPKCFPVRGDPVACNRGGRTFDDVYQATLRRKHELETMGYTVVQMWEHDYNRKIRDDVNFKSFVERVTVFDPLEPRKCFYGGRTNAIKLHHKIVDDEKIRYIDICSLYPYVNSRCSYPIGHPDVITENFRGDISEYYGLIKCSILPPRGLFLPVLPYRSGGKLTFPLCATCANTCNQHDVCTHNETERVLLGEWVTLEVEKAISLGYKIIQIHEVWHWNSHATGLFKDYINQFLKVKTEASGWPRDNMSEAERDKCIDDYKFREGVHLEKEKIKKISGLRTVAKLCLNSMWGKLGQKQNKTTSKYISDPGDLFAMINDSSLEISDVLLCNDGIANKNVRHCK